MKRLLVKLLLSFCNEYQRPSIYRRLGVVIGSGCRFTGTIHFGSEPYLVTIGDHVTLAHGVTFHTHDGGVWVLRDKYPNINRYGRICIGNNVFIGGGVILLPNVTIGDNVVIGAGSVVTRSIGANSVVAGNPARVIKTTDEYEAHVLLDSVIVDSSQIRSAAPVIKAAARRRE